MKTIAIFVRADPETIKAIIDWLDSRIESPLPTDSMFGAMIRLNAVACGDVYTPPDHTKN